MSEINVQVKEEGDSHRTLSIEIASSRVKREKEKILSRFQKKAKIPGFRPGKIPKQLIENKYSDDIRLELMESVISSAYKEALEAQHLVPISQPRFSNVESSLDSSMSFDATFDVTPKVEVKRYTGFRIEKPAVHVSDSEVEKVLERLRRERAVSHPVQRPAGEGDLVGIEYLSLNEDGTQAGSESRKSLEVLLGDGGVLEDIEQGIIGMHTGEEKEIPVNYPEDYFVKELRGSRKKLKLTVKEVKEVELPSLDDEFAKSIDQTKNLDSLREDIRERIREEKEQHARTEVREKLIDLVIEANPFEAPKVIVETYLDQFLERLREDRKVSGQDFDPAAVRDMYRPAAVRVFKKNFFLESISKSEGIDATDEDIEAELKNISQGSEPYLDSLRKGLEKDPAARENLRRDIRLKKVEEFLVNNSEVREDHE